MQTNAIEQRPKINPHIHSQMIFNKAAKTMQWGKLYTQSVQRTVYCTLKNDQDGKFYVTCFSLQLKTSKCKINALAYIIQNSGVDLGFQIMALGLFLYLQLHFLCVAFSHTSPFHVAVKPVSGISELTWSLCLPISSM